MKSKIEVAGGVGKGLFQYYHVLLSEFAYLKQSLRKSEGVLRRLKKQLKNSFED
jgi:hypothetical protein